MKYTVEYIKNKKKGQSKQKAVFLELEGYCKDCTNSMNAQKDRKN